MRTFQVNTTIGFGADTLEPGDIATLNDLRGQEDRLIGLGSVTEIDPKPAADAAKEGKLQRRIDEIEAKLAEVDDALRLVSVLTPEEKAELEQRLKGSERDTDLQKMTVPQLAEKAMEMGIDPVPGKKAEIIEAIQNKEAEGA